jgi:hypothetical protein
MMKNESTFFPMFPISVTALPYLKVSGFARLWLLSELHG